MEGQRWLSVAIVLPHFVQHCSETLNDHLNPPKTYKNKKYKIICSIEAMVIYCNLLSLSANSFLSFIRAGDVRLRAGKQCSNTDSFFCPVHCCCCCWVREALPLAPGAGGVWHSQEQDPPKSVHSSSSSSPAAAALRGILLPLLTGHFIAFFYTKVGVTQKKVKVDS